MSHKGSIPGAYVGTVTSGFEPWQIGGSKCPALALGWSRGLGVFQARPLSQRPKIDLVLYHIQKVLRSGIAATAWEQTLNKAMRLPTLLRSNSSKMKSLYSTASRPHHMSAAPVSGLHNLARDIADGLKLALRTGTPSQTRSRRQNQRTVENNMDLQNVVGRVRC